ncbi:MAG: carboxypeptidase-like regulatory domain-containing protein, partial [bacterium]
QPVLTSDWTVVNGEYRARTNATDFMTSVYTAQSWTDYSVQASLRHVGNDENSAGVVLRASADFDASAAGQGYLFLISSNSYAVFWFDGGAADILQGWSVSPRILSGSATNLLVASAQGSQLRFYINGSMVWTGTDSRFASGMMALVGFTESGSQTTHYFDNLIVDTPRVTGLNPGGKQRYLNGLQQLKSRLEGCDAAGVLMHPAGSADDGDANIATYFPIGSGLNWGPFAINNLPTFPAILPPGSNVTFDVVYDPATPGSNQTIVSIASDDNDTPQVNVSVNGRASAGVLTGRVAVAWSGAVLTGATITVTDVSTNWVTTTDTSGFYRLDLLSGPYAVTAAASHFVTAGTTGVVITDSGITTQDFALEGLVTITASALPHGSIAPSGDVVVALGGSTTFVVTADAYYYIESVLTNGGAVAYAKGVGSTNVHWQNIASSGSILAGFGESLAPRGTPEWWLALYGLTSGTPAQIEMTDGDRDGSLTWQEYWAGTDPTNSYSVLKLVEFNVSNGTVRLAWPSTTNGHGYPYRIQSATDLLVAAWSDASTNQARRPPTNDCLLAVPFTNGVNYYRVVATTNAP